jgi:hypothetical protein
VERDASAAVVLAAASGVGLRVLAESVQLSAELELDYWEVDPRWDRQLFRSAAQSQRSNGGTDVPRELTIKTGRNICVRLVTVQGELLQQELDV